MRQPETQYVLYTYDFNLPHLLYIHLTCLSTSQLYLKMCPALLPFHRGTRSTQRTAKAQEPPEDIWRMPDMADKWRRSCARLRAPSLSGSWSYRAAHTRLCLLSLWHRKATSRRDGKRGKWKKSEERGEKRVDGWKTDGIEIKVNIETDHKYRRRYSKDIVVAGMFNHPAGPQHMICLDFFHNNWESDTH